MREKQTVMEVLRLNLVKIVGSFYALLQLPADGGKDIEKKEKLVSIYITIVAIIAALNRVPAEKTVLLAYFVFFIAFIFYFIYLGSNNKNLMSVFGFCVSVCLSFILTNFAIVLSPDLPDLSIIYWIIGIGLTIVIAISLINPLDHE